MYKTLRGLARQSECSRKADHHYKGNRCGEIASTGALASQLEVLSMGEVTFRNVAKTYDQKQWVIRDFSLTIQDGEFCVLLGPSGCGKSTVLRMIAGLEEISSGEILVDGEVINSVLPKDRDVAMVFQNYALYPHKTVFQNIEYPLKLRKMPEDQRKRQVVEAAELLNIENILQRYPRQLSGGQKQRVAVGRALVRRPRVYLFDEPLSNLDARLRSSMRSELKLLHRKFGITFVYVTHDQVEALTLADRVVLLKNGTLQQVGSAEAIYHHPRTLFAASFIGSPPMNLYKVKRGRRMDFGNFEIASKQFEEQAEIIVGIRPEALSFDPGYSEQFFEADWILSENVGKEVHHHLNPLAHEVISDHCIATAASDIKQNEPVVRVFFQPQDLKLYSAESQELLVDGLKG
jgi:multiple sugar transport system ATP-binding protein